MDYKKATKELFKIRWEIGAQLSFRLPKDGIYRSKAEVELLQLAVSLTTPPPSLTHKITLP